MKNISLFLFVFLIAISCKDEEMEAEVQNLREENARLSQNLSQQDSTLRIFNESFTSIQENLSLIGDREESIQVKQGELGRGEDTRDAITRDIQTINSLIDENKKTIDRLNKTVANYGGEVAGFKKLVAQLNSDIEAKEAQIGTLKENLTAANFTIDILNVMLDSTEYKNEIQSQMIEEQTTNINTAHYAIGTFKELSENKVVEKKGGIIGIAATKTLMDDFNKDYFAEIDIRNVNTIPLNAEDVQIVTIHPKDSYTLSGEEEKTLAITNPKKFWSASKYLVVVID